MASIEELKAQAIKHGAIATTYFMKCRTADRNGELYQKFIAVGTSRLTLLTYRNEFADEGLVSASPITPKRARALIEQGTVVAHPGAASVLGVPYERPSVELEEEYCQIAERRIEHAKNRT